MQVRGGGDADDVSLYAMCRRWVQNAVDVDTGPRQPVQVCYHTVSTACLVCDVDMVHAGGLPTIAPKCCAQEICVVKLPPPLVASSEAGKEPPKEVALLQDEETLFLDEDTLPAEVGLTLSAFPSDSRLKRVA